MHGLCAAVTAIASESHDRSAPVHAMKHPDRIARYPGSLTDLATEVGDLRYDALATFLHALSANLATDGEKDGARGRASLAASLQRASALVADAARETETTWNTCAPHMRDDDEP